MKTDKEDILLVLAAFRFENECLSKELSDLIRERKALNKEIQELKLKVMYLKEPDNNKS